jgi:tetratricopeptide (TPR) repeat protein
VPELLLSIIVGCALGGVPHDATGGGGPETTLIVVNADSALSLKIANAYVALRDIPQSHLVWLRDVPSLEIIDVGAFRERIWNPIRKFISAHALDGQIDTIAYSTDFPYAVNLRADIKGNRLPRNRHRGSIASLTGVTFFARRVEIGDVGYLNLDANQYFRRNLAIRPTPRPLDSNEKQLEQKAQTAFRKKDYATATELYRALISTHTGIPRVWYELASSLVLLGHTDEAMDTLHKAVDNGLAISLVARSDPNLKNLQDRPRFRELLARMETYNGPFEPAHGFRSRYFWDRWSLPDPTTSTVALNRYYLATMLAYTGVRGNSVPESLQYLTSAAASDGTFPDGTVYLLVNRNIRSRARQRFFPATVKALQRRGRRAEILTRGETGQNGVLPLGRDDVVGAVVGAKSYRWARSNSSLLPGAIAESLTSYGGHFDRGSQTKLSEFLRHGAAGSSGAVAEPFSFQAKFPNSMLHVYYADGCSLAESFYQSISAPYQLIVVGDPLARPFAHPADVGLAAPNPDLPWRDTVTIRPRVVPAPKRPIARVELWVNGIQVAEAAAGQSISWDTRSIEDGQHELRLVAVEAGPIETRSYAKFSVTIANSDKRIEGYARRSEVLLGDTIDLAGSAPGAERVHVLRGFLELGSVPVTDGEWRVRVPTGPLGLGQSAVVARAAYADDSTVRSPPIAIRVLEPPRVKADADDSESRAGLRALVNMMDGGKRELVVKTLDGHLREFAKENTGIESLRLQGDLRIQTSGFYQFTVNSRGRLRIRINDRDFGGHHLTDQNSEVFLPLSLDEGWHRLSMELVPEGSPHVKVVVAGDQVAAVLNEKMLRHKPQRDEWNR